MPATPHIEKHFTATETVRDVVIGMSDGLTVPFALAAGLSGAVASSGIIVTAGLAEIAAGSIAMGLGGYLAAKTDREHYESERRREFEETEQKPDQEEREVLDILTEFGLTQDQAKPVSTALRSDVNRWVDFMMRFELGLEAPAPARARRSAATIAGSYVMGGFIPLAPYIFIAQASSALLVSVAVTLAALFIFGYIKGRFTGLNPLKGAAQTVVIGGLAAGWHF